MQEVQAEEMLVPTTTARRLGCWHGPVENASQPGHLGQLDAAPGQAQLGTLGPCNGATPTPTCPVPSGYPQPCPGLRAPGLCGGRDSP